MRSVATQGRGIRTIEMRPYRDISTGYTYFANGDILFSKITPCMENGKHAIADLGRARFGFGTTEFHVVRPGARLTAKYLLEVLTQPHLIEHCARQFTGSAGQRRVPADVLRSLPLLLPTVSEQRALSSVLDALDDALTRHDALIQVISRLRDALRERLLSNGTTDRHHSFTSVRHLGRIPSTWRIHRLGDLCIPPRYGAPASARPYDPSQPRYVRITDITDDGRLRPFNACSADPAAVRGYELQDGDVLFARSGVSVGRTYRYRDSDGPCVYAGYLIRFRLSADSAISPGFLDLWTHSRTYRRWVASMLRAGAQPNINALEYASLPVPVPSHSEQTAIVLIMDAVETTLDTCRAAYRAILALRSALCPSLLSGNIRSLSSPGPQQSGASQARRN